MNLAKYLSFALEKGDFQMIKTVTECARTSPFAQWTFSICISPPQYAWTDIRSIAHLRKMKSRCAWSNQVPSASQFHTVRTRLLPPTNHSCYRQGQGGSLRCCLSGAYASLTADRRRVDYQLHIQEFHTAHSVRTNVLDCEHYCLRQHPTRSAGDLWLFHHHFQL